ncbi:MAG: hypothetical protein E7019_02220 [Alphaproteobacteria bacterium]|nr:hypothetical protein [Alphaproteobacteria bacterium]
MAATKETRARKVEEATQRWIEMETSDLVKELNELEEKEELLSEEISIIRALKKALKEILKDRDMDDIYRSDDYMSEEDMLRSINGDY